MAAYESYKDSGVKWLGKIPSHWEVKSLRNFLRPFSERNHSDKQLLSVTRDKGVIVRGAKGEDDNHNVIPEDLSGYKHVLPGDFVINKMKSWQGSYGVSDFEGIVSPAYITYHLDFANKRFFSLALRSSAYIPFFMQYSKGIRVDQWDLTPDALKTIPFFLPSPNEQEAIVAYLDKVTGDIDRAIEAQKKMIDVLSERKQIIITRAVIRGLNPDVPLCDSGIDWLGQIPKHWDFCKLKYFIRIKSGDSISNTQLADSGSYLVYGGGEPLGRYNKYNVDKGNIVIGRVGARCGCITPIYEKAWATDNALVVLSKGIDYQFLIYCLMAADLNKIASTNAQPLLTGTKVKNTYITVPLRGEQREIVSYIGNATKNIDVCISNCERMISLLQERKQIIINEVVTGKKKVI